MAWKSKQLIQVKTMAGNKKIYHMMKMKIKFPLKYLCRSGWSIQLRDKSEGPLAFRRHNSSIPLLQIQILQDANGTAIPRAVSADSFCSAGGKNLHPYFKYTSLSLLASYFFVIYISIKFQLVQWEWDFKKANSA